MLISEASVQSASQVLRHWAGLVHGGRLLAILDAAQSEELIDRLYEHPSLRFDVLARGDVADDVFYQSPFLVDVSEDEALLSWILEGLGQSWGVFVSCPPQAMPASAQEQATGATADSVFDRAHRHLRSFVMVRDERGQVKGLRFYDPRVFSVLTEVLNAAQWQDFFAPESGLGGLAFESAAGRELTLAAPGPEGVVLSVMPLAASAAGDARADVTGQA